MQGILCNTFHLEKIWEKCNVQTTCSKSWQIFLVLLSQNSCLKAVSETSNEKLLSWGALY